MIVSGILSLTGTAGRNTWISAILVILLVVPVYFIYFYPIKVLKGKDFFEIQELLYGKSIAKAVNVIYILATMLVCVVSLSRYTIFVKTVALKQTDVWIIALFMAIVMIYATYCGFEVVARFAELAIIVIAIFLVFTLLLSMTAFDISNVKPVLEDGIKPVIDGSFTLLMTPFVEDFAFIALLSNVKDRNNMTKTIAGSVVVSAIVMCIVFLRNLMILGYPMVEILRYPSYQAISVVSIGSFLQRQEVTVSATFLIADIIRLSILTIFICKGVNFLKGKRNYHRYSIPVVAIIYVVSVLLLSTATKLFEFLEIYKWVLVGPLVILPCISCAIARFKIKKRTV